LTFSWKAVEGAEKYAARLEGSDGKLFAQKNPVGTNVTFEEVTEGKSYAFKVRAVAGTVSSDYSTPLTVTAGNTPTEEPPVEPENPQPEDPKPDNPPVSPSTPSQYYVQFKIPAGEDAHGKALAFPGAEGGGMYTTGGRGGKVIHVTTLADSGTGSLRAALNESGARTIVFDVAGLIELGSTLNIAKGDVTIAGQTAPGDGICIKNFSTRVNADNVIIRFVRFRMGDEKKVEGDALEGRYHDNIIIDHCSMSWSTDECASFYANRNFTMQWCILTESLRMSVHGKGEHGYGGIWGGKNASFHHNLLANHDSRNPRIDHPQIYDSYVSTHRGNVDVRCNVIYNWGGNVTYGGEDGWFNIVNNYYKPGPASTDRRYFVDAYGKYTKDGKVYADSYPQLYLSGNVNTRHSLPNDISSIYWHDGSSYGNYQTILSSPLTLKGPQSQDVFTTVHTADMTFERVCASAGASLVRDAVDIRASSDAVAGKATITDGGNGSKGGLIDTQSAAGGWPVYEASAEQIARVKDTDGDGMPDWFEDMFGLKKSDASDGNLKTLDSYGRYTNLEMYLHYLVKDIVEAQNRGGLYDEI
jgi:pectate lyase